MSTVTCDDLPLQLISWLSVNGLQSPLSVASVSGGFISIHPLSFRSSQSFRVVNSKRCIYEVALEDDDETLRNVIEDGRITLQFEVLPTTSTGPQSAPSPACQLVKIQGTGLVHERGSSAYNAILNPPPSPSMNQWYPRAVVAVSVQRVLISHAGPGMSPSMCAQAPATAPPFREATPRPVASSRRSVSRSHQSEFGAMLGGWPVGGDACCAT